ncbi:hypothetical protein ACFV9D_28170 [Streptomyces sp. NPDC059875]|uniref:hypothetical protein n=1 Tax=unclassified Streptomyces TaxID=2593676 RepID=UPI0036660462
MNGSDRAAGRGRPGSPRTAQRAPVTGAASATATARQGRLLAVVLLALLGLVG